MTELLPESQLAALESGEIQVVGRITSASNATLLCEVAGRDAGMVVRCVYKPVRGEVPLWDFPDGTLAGREVASRMVDQALGWDVIPPTILRDGPAGPGMVQLWVGPNPDGPNPDGPNPDDPDPDGPDPSSAISEVDLVDLVPPEDLPAGYLPVMEAIVEKASPPGYREVMLAHADDAQLLRMAVLDVLLNNADRKGGHIIASASRLYGIDHGICLHAEPKLRTVLWGWAGKPVPTELRADVVTLLERLTSATDELAPQLAEHITVAEVAALGRRAEALLKRPTMPEPRSHRPIPWPPF